MSTPPTPGPTTSVSWYRPKFSASALRSSRGSTRLGMIAERTTFWTALKPASAPPSTYSPQQRRIAGERDRRQPGGCGDEPDLHEQQQHAAVEAVGDGAAEERHRDQRHQLDRPEQAGEERRPGLEVDLERQRDEHGLRAEPGDELSEDEQPQVARGAQRREVDDEAAQRAGGSGTPSSSCSAMPRSSRSASLPAAPMSDTPTGSPLRRPTPDGSDTTGIPVQSHVCVSAM